MSVKPMRIPHGQLGGDDVGDMSYGDETNVDDGVRGFGSGEGRGARRVYVVWGGFTRI